ncbi:RNA-dependent RNA polymerase [Coprinopsis cinerea okayama7|uniref:RNA-dependent RNA polymerase n=1 Tax=Coprinopsis cinerea (strain Okayama-7 / 130 / ATCC MYA-4618 / FGSC 9003) TaxID=240176 RepID=A8NE19_COPC7|nr:RNA-dependent RNA polymerase [Coprinopsis cinerea okayama7\|eukprot:XP_001832921.2 RNA-dependent RNA polymerase [Coprinopsis cinerea okayama7\
MEIHMKGLNFNFDRTRIILSLAYVLHGPDFLAPSAPIYNFHVHLLPDKRFMRLHSGTGFLTLPTMEIGARFLQLYGPGGAKAVELDGRRVMFNKSRKDTPRPDALATIRLMPYRDPRQVEKEEKRAAELESSQVPINAIQFGWDCRDGILSIEAEDRPRKCTLSFDEENRRYCVAFIGGDGDTYVIAFRAPSIDYMSAHSYLEQEYALVIFLNDPPTYQRIPRDGSSQLAGSSESLDWLAAFLKALEITNSNSPPIPRQQLSFLPIEGHKRVAPFASLVLRLVFRDRGGLDQFEHLRKLANARRADDYEYPIDRRGLFSQMRMDLLQEHIRSLEWDVAYQVEAIVGDRSIDIKEMLEIIPDIHRLTRSKGSEYTATFLKAFGNNLKALYIHGGDQYDDDPDNAVRRCFNETEDGFAKTYGSPSLEATDGSNYQSLHVTVTPTAIFLEGPYPEQSNRVIRAYDPQHHSSFLRVTFADEGRLQYRSSDRQVDHKAFVRARFGDILLNGLEIAGRRFEFLAYSMSALKEHSVWFVKPFDVIENGHRVTVTADSIIQSLGTFDGLDFEPRLMHCPARYAARISQAFTATDLCTIEVQDLEITVIDDIEVTSGGHKWTHTDGVGTMSPMASRAIWKALPKRKGPAPAADQVRIGGAKGMLSVDYTLTGHKICLRPSMVKFEAPTRKYIEIARAFDRPTPYYLNRPLIMILEGLGVPYSTFEHFQDRAVRETRQAASSLRRAASMLDSYGLGSSFRLSSVMNSLDRLGIRHLNPDKFYSKAMEFAINHVLRDLKNHARIPIPGAWTLVGVADVHRFLQPGEIFAYVKPTNEKGFYLEGDILISRSPCIHPGDVRITRAIGPPPPGSPFEREPLANTVVFNVLASCLGGGDLDGDTYNLLPLSDPALQGFRPTRIPEPSQYAPAEKRYLEEKSTMRDVAEFVLEYILSDVLGMVSINWRIIADQSRHAYLATYPTANGDPDSTGIFDSDCMLLADLHSAAVDYPKSGTPVDFKKIPRLKHKLKPDWNAPETLDAQALSEKYYVSSTALGKLFRRIELPVEKGTVDGAYEQHRRRRRRRGRTGAQEDEPMLNQDRYFNIIAEEVENYLDEEMLVEEYHSMEEIKGILSRFTTELEAICFSHTLSTGRDASLTEAEALIGTISQKTSQPKRRKELMSKLREKTDLLVRGTREVLEGPDTSSLEVYLQRAWNAWQLSLERGTQFGAQSFGWVTLGAVFDAMKRIEERNMEEEFGAHRRHLN